MDADDEITREIEVSILPRSQALAAQGITSEAFQASLLVAIEQRELLAEQDDVSDDEIPPLEEMLLNIDGKSYKLEDLADVEICGDIP